MLHLVILTTQYVIIKVAKSLSIYYENKGNLKKYSRVVKKYLKGYKHKAEIKTLKI